MQNRGCTKHTCPHFAEIIFCKGNERLLHYLSKTTVILHAYLDVTSITFFRVMIQVSQFVMNYQQCHKVTKSQKHFPCS